MRSVRARQVVEAHRGRVARDGRGAALEVSFAALIEVLWGKRRTLEVYLNVVEWGAGIYGAEAAAQHYYGKTAADLEPEEAARLAAMIPSPRLYTHNWSTAYLDQRTDILLDQMEDARVP